MYRLRTALLQPHSQYIPSIYRQLSTQKQQQQQQQQPQERQQQQADTDADHREKILTIPNALTMARIVSSPYIGYLIVQGQYEWALSGCIVFGLTDALDGYIARKYNMQSFVGSILDPAADKILMTTLTLALSFNGLMPGLLAGVIIGRDLALSLAALVVRWATLPEPRTARRYFDLSVLSVEVRPTLVSKWNTALQLALVAASLAAPVCGVAAAECMPLAALQWATGATTVASGVGYLFSRDAVHRLTKAELAKRMPKPHVLPGPIKKK
ncbi:CDP-alcohol phosphatidyltransferase-domain-containing protein [Kickxella alabastrina]|uniref:CDP-alcohol phosphatidyltransferase-domain-containing protein n=1 Tax=Kickxella alabastrina TaxID=61397 RepID=UPI002220AE8A|nr:CDP-alcohol phosphatidyltransferase-domain-containing protein [Kickxella alabastrina]KAI7835161.1 CDP-alcohol phosphatidyltransferase-domain-containing protein [Kickxella alabastrina]